MQVLATIVTTIAAATIATATCAAPVVKVGPAVCVQGGDKAGQWIVGAGSMRAV